MKQLVQLALCLAVSTPVFAQRYLATEVTPPSVHLVDTQAGALFSYRVIDLAALGLNGVRDAARVGSEVWVSTNSGIHRFDATNFNFIASTPTGLNSPRGIQAVADGAWVTHDDGTLRKYDFTGTTLFQVPVLGARDVFLWNGELIVSSIANDRLHRYDLVGQHLGALTTTPLPAPNGKISLRPSTGNLLVGVTIRIAEINSAGQVVALHQAGIGEQSAEEMLDGRMIVLNHADATIFTPGQAFSFGNAVPTTNGRNFQSLAPFDTGGLEFNRFCPASANSTGSSVTLSARGTTSISDGSLYLDAFGGPANQFGMVVYGNGAPATPYGDGTLCLGTTPIGIVRTSSLGVFGMDGSRISMELPYSSFSPSAPVIVGSTWSFQYVYRDAASQTSQFNASDAIELTFQ